MTGEYKDEGAWRDWSKTMSRISTQRLEAEVLSNYLPCRVSNEATASSTQTKKTSPPNPLYEQVRVQDVSW